MVIDYEYSGWNPMAMDLANYLNETMFDNNTLKFVAENCMTPVEVDSMAESYLNDYWDKYMLPIVKEEYFDKKYFIHVMKRGFVSDIWKCALLNNFFWAVWAIKMIDDPTEPGLFNYDFAKARIEAYQKIKSIIN